MQIVNRVFDLEGALFTKSLKDADIGIYLGYYLCDYDRPEGYIFVNDIFNEVKNRNISAVMITNGNLYHDYCSKVCPENLKMLELKNQGKNVNHIPLGHPYNRCPILK